MYPYTQIQREEKEMREDFDSLQVLQYKLNATACV